jgi:hypothetical protein
MIEAYFDARISLRITEGELAKIFEDGFDLREELRSKISFPEGVDLYSLEVSHVLILQGPNPQHFCRGCGATSVSGSNYYCSECEQEWHNSKEPGDEHYHSS